MPQRFALPALTMKLLLVAALGLLTGEEVWAEEAATEILPISQRFAVADAAEVPDFQKHVSPLFGRLGCNGRACHGSFQGRGGFRLSLFGYDFPADHESLLEKDKGRVAPEKPLESLILTKPTDAELHEGGLRFPKDQWEYQVLRRWIEAGASFDVQKVQKLVRLEVTPAEILFQSAGQTVQIKAVAIWPDGMREDVTPLCRFQTNSEQVAKISPSGVVTSGGPGDTHVVAFYDKAVATVPVIRPVSDQVGEKYPSVAVNNQVDVLVAQKLSKLGIVPSEICTDVEFLRRLSLDLTGTLPTASEVEAFLADESPEKRAAKIDELLTTPAYAAWWTTKLCDYTGNNDRQLNNTMPIQGTTSQAWYDWLYKRVAENTPYDQIAEGIVLARSRPEGQSYAEYCQEMSEIYHPNSAKKFADRDCMPFYWARNNLRQPEERAIGFAYTFLGIRIQCAQCHKHPFDQWSKADFDAFKGFFTRIAIAQNGPREKEAQKEYQEILAKLEISPDKKNGNDLRRQFPEMLKQGKTVPFSEVVVLPSRIAPQRPGKQPRPDNKNRPPAPQATARILGGEDQDLTSLADPRQALMEWLRSKENPYFAKAFVNRVWASYFNVGIVQPTDDHSLANPPSNGPLLDYLTQGFIEHQFDMQWLHREILVSRTYQLSWKPNETNAQDERNFSRCVPRRLPAEVAYDAVQMATASDAKAAVMRGELKGRAIALAGASAQNGGNRGGNANFALTVFGRSIRESNCDCDRSAEASLLQTVFLQNDNQVLQAVNGGKDSWMEQMIPASKSGVNGAPRFRTQADVNKEIAKLQVRLERAKKDQSPKGNEQVTRIETRIAEMQKFVITGDQPAPTAPLPIDGALFIRQAYLRTLSRFPTDEEMNRCQQYLSSASSPAEGAKGLLWTLLNTKEFIVNH